VSGPTLQEAERSILESDHAVPLQQIKDHQDHHSHGNRDREATHALPATMERPHGALPVLTAVAIETNSALSAPPSELAPSMIPKAISAAIKPYSMAVAPESSRRKLAINCIFAQAPEPPIKQVLGLTNLDRVNGRSQFLSS